MATPDDGFVLVTGAAGGVGSFLRPRLRAAGWTVRGIDRAPAPDGDPEVVIGDATDPAVLDALLPGAAAVVHLAGIPHESPFDAIVAANVVGTQVTLEAAARHGVRRVVLASSNHAVGMHRRPANGDLGTEVRPRPDTFYGVSKVTMEALGQLYADRFGLEVVSLRIGSCREDVTSVRELSTWLSPDDAARLVNASLRGEVRGHTVAYGISANTRAWWDLTSARALGYDPQDDAERFAATVDPDPTGAEFAGGPFVTAPVGEAM